MSDTALPAALVPCLRAARHNVRDLKHSRPLHSPVLVLWWGVLLACAAAAWCAPGCTALQEAYMSINKDYRDSLNRGYTFTDSIHKTALKDGEVVMGKGPGQQDLFIVVNGSKHSIPLWTAFLEAGYDGSEVQLVSPTLLQGLPDGEVIRAKQPLYKKATYYRRGRLIADTKYPQHIPADAPGMLCGICGSCVSYLTSLAGLLCVTCVSHALWAVHLPHYFSPLSVFRVPLCFDRSH